MECTRFDYWLSELSISSELYVEGIGEVELKTISVGNHYVEGIGHILGDVK